MRKVILFIAMSLDGYIADNKGNVDWLECGKEDVDRYTHFIQNIDTILLGFNTYRQIITELSPDKWVYPQQKSYVFTHQNISSTQQVTFTQESPAQLLTQLKQQDGKDIWVCGGANLIQQLIESNLIDEYQISIIPIILGGGVKLFAKNCQQIPLSLINAQKNGHTLECTYQKK
ncbi:riboflavin biosynthesis protein RibD [Helicobacter monodelphidis]|uniref:dihydrofolate reductase family protein n=1 Tax=Helicobacter sp. 15-1451 TaxID=2004995 RepID=UPI000DCB9425|nr:dihydrofolate reductase family protein [Helicobacter sp. 15-1451]RAX56708.1 riboflavin biosynthesis protein RibD [Helicobacter sp. 15-1451]